MDCPWLLSPTLAKLRVCGRDQQAHKAEYIPYLARYGKNPLTYGLVLWALAGLLGLAFLPPRLKVNFVYVP